MPKDEWGVKRLCPHCASRFYDLQSDPMTCPECDHTFTAESLVAVRGRTMAAEKSAAVQRAAVVEDIDAEVEVEVEDDAPEIELDDDLLEDDEDDNVSLDEIADVGAGEDDA